MKLKLLIFTLLIGGLFITSGCGDDSASCEDGKQNQGETGIDCGGPCPNCDYFRTCSDGLQNGDEIGVDCGGPCPNACPEIPETPEDIFFEATINGAAWSATQVSGSAVNGRLTISGLNNDGTNNFNIVLTYSEEFTTRTSTFDLMVNTASIVGSTIGGECQAQSGGSITFSKFDTTNKLVSGTFEFDCQDVDDTANNISSGKFENIPY